MLFMQQGQIPRLKKLNCHFEMNRANGRQYGNHSFTRRYVLRRLRVANLSVVPKVH